MTLDEDGGFVASQMWEVVSAVISYSSDLMNKLFATVGAQQDEVSPFCRSFSSLADLRDEFVRYLPRTFNYDNVGGDGIEQPNEDETGGTAGTPIEELVAARIERFAREMSEKDDDEVVEIVTVDDDQPSAVSDEYTATVAGTPVEVAELTYPDLMRHFQAILTVSSPDNLLDKVLVASSCLEGKGHIRGSISFAKKAKSLVQRWLAKPIDVMAEGGTAFVDGDVLIERDVVILASVKIGTGATATIVNRLYRVVDIYDKHYNKWFMSKSKSPVKKWKKEVKSYKLKIRMLDKDALNEYCDVGLNDISTYDKESICRIIEEKIDDSKIVGVVGKLNHA